MKCCGMQNCISQTQVFRDICLKRHVLRAAATREAEFLYELEADYENDNYRHLAYKQYVCWANGWLGPKQRSALPACACLAIRMSYPSTDGTYKEFRFAR